MTSGVIVTGLLALLVVIFILARQVVQRAVTQQSLLLPLMLSLALAGVFLASRPTPDEVTAVIVGAVLGIGTGLLAAQVIRVWRDEATGAVLQRGGWRYVVVLAVLLVVRVLIRFIFIWSGNAVDEAALNAALIAALMGNVLGRDVRTALRAVALAGGSFSKLPSRSIRPVR